MTTKITPIKSGRVGEGEWHNLRQCRQCQWLPWKRISVHLLLQYHLLWSSHFAPGLEGLWILIFTEEESKSPRDDASKPGSPLRVVSKAKELKWDMQGVWVLQTQQAPFPRGSLFHEPAEQWDHDFLQSYFAKQVIYTCVKVEIIPSTVRHQWLLGAGPFCLPDGEKQNPKGRSSDLIQVLALPLKRLKEQGESGRDS